MIVLPDFIRQRPRLAFFAMLAVAVSGFGQTFFVSVFGEEIRAVTGLTHTAYGSLYSLATLISAAMLFKWGRIADTWPLCRAATLAIMVLSLGCLLVGVGKGAFLLGLGFVCIRFGGQGLMGHLGMTTAARYFFAHRGKAVALAGSGFPLAEAVLPASAVFIAAAWGWQTSWLSASVFLVLCMLPLALYLTRDIPAPAQAMTGDKGNEASGSFTREQVLKDPGLYLILPAILASPFMLTALLFHQAAIASMLGWSMQVVGTAFTCYAAGHLGALLGTGPLVDRISAGKTLPLSVLPMTAGLGLLSAFQGVWVAYAYLGLMGISHGMTATAGGALWAERYGLLHLGAIRGMAHSAVVFSTAAAPLMMGFFLDQGLGISIIAAALAAATLAGGISARIAPLPRCR
ncbi:MFS transporter [Desulfonatronospira sp.]|uniref:MFS transporter n=1 Tax=Desulfonatronospira sp. TaxID=1962951 RepID=UPI0025B97D42|nr:MFS transporter [Desulfonatronospira sp.]